MYERLLMRSGFIFIALAMLITVPASAGAQSSFPPSAGPTISLESSPRFPVPGEVVTLEVRSFSMDLAGADITWLVDGAAVTSGRGVTTFQTQAGAIGSDRVVMARVATDAVILEEELVVRPTVIDLVWEPLAAYAAPLYRGKTLASHNSLVRVVALPQFVRPGGENVSPENLVFTWERDGRVLGSKSGTGRNVVELDALLPFRDARISVEVRSLDNALHGRGSITISPVSPNIILYQNHPLLGTLFNTALRTTSLTDQEEFVAEVYPYFSTVASKNSNNLVYSWSISDRVIENPSDDPSSIVLRRTAAGATGATIQVSVSHLTNFLQRAATSFRLEFTTDGNRNSSPNINGVF